MGHPLLRVYRPFKVKIPSLSKRTREGWGTRCVPIHARSLAPLERTRGFGMTAALGFAHAWSVPVFVFSSSSAKLTTGR